MGSAEGQPAPATTWVPGPIIVGAGPSGLATAACLSRHGVPSTVLEKSHCLASLWQHRTYDRLKLHLPKQFCHLPFLPFPSNFPKYPSKRHFISYLSSYAAAFRIEPLFGRGVERAEFDPNAGTWTVRTQTGEVFASRWLVVATGENADPFVPHVQGMERFSGSVTHTCGYRSGAEFRGEKVLVIGCGNSGMEVSLDLHRHGACPYIVVRNSVHVLPREMFGLSTFGVAMALLKWLPLRLVDKFLLAVAHLILGDTDRLGLRRPKVGPIALKNLTGKTPVLDVGSLSQIKSGNIKVVGGVKEITREGARFVDGREERFDSIILATGYKSNVASWLKFMIERLYALSVFLQCIAERSPPMKEIKLLNAGFSINLMVSSSTKQRKGGDDLFTKQGMPKAPFPNGWKGEKGLYCVGFTKRGLLGTSSDALNIAKDISQQWKKKETQN